MAPIWGNYNINGYWSSNNNWVNTMEFGPVLSNQTIEPAAPQVVRVRIEG